LPPLSITHESDVKPILVIRSARQEWELVLLADGLSPHLHRSQDAIVIAVPEREWERAGASLAAYDSENPPKHMERREPVRPASLLTGFVVAAMFLAFFYITIGWKPTMPWFERGSADAARILDGELWRTVTALTLHVDLVHVMSNAVGIAIFLGAVSSLLGPGIGCALVLLAGAGGNFINALAQGSPHLSIGASTSVFGAVGILGGLEMARRRRQTVRRRRAWMPIVAALALLGLLGTEGQRVDIWAHFFGFVSGGFLGIIYSFAASHRQGHLVQWGSGTAALAVLIACWIVALV
jgi:rhomboid protease GluP